jgi:serine protease
MEISKRVFLLLASGLLIFQTRAAQLRLRIHPEYRLMAEKQNGDWIRIWQSRSLPLPVRCFSRHLPVEGRISESGFGPTDLSLWYSVEVPAAKKSDFLLASLQGLPYFRFVEWKSDDAFPLSQPNDPAADSSNGAQRTVLQKIRAYEAWSISKGDSNVVIGVLDTGTPIAHEDFAANLKLNEADPVNGIDDDQNGLIDDYRGWDFGSNDPDPTPDNNGTSPGHGTSVASLAAARTNNGTGIAGIGWRCKLLPVKIWKWAGNFSNFSGYEAIVYAADMGCKVINCSWGSPKAGSQYEQDIIRYATFNKNALVVAAGGNTPGYYQFMPANYDYAFGVSMTNNNDQIFWAASRHFKLDIMAPGVEVYGIQTSGNYGLVEGGTSMASPLVAGAAALLLSRFPNLNGLQAGELLRVNSDTIYSVPGNAGYRDQTGRGRLNILRAMQLENRISLRAVECIPGKKARPGDTLRLALRFENYLDSVPGFSVSLQSADPDFVLINSSAVFGPLGGWRDRVSDFLFSGRVNPSLSGRKEVSLRAEVQAGNYKDVRWFTIQLNPEWLTLDSNEISISICENGRLGHADLAGYLGDGIRYRGADLSSDGGLLLGTSPDKVSNCVFTGPGTDQHFRAENRVTFQAWPGLDQHAVVHLNDSLAGAHANGIAIKQSAYESTADSLKSVVFLTYQLRNRNNYGIDSLCVGLYNDWDIDIPDQNYSRWIDSLRIGFTQGSGIRNLLAGTMLLDDAEPQFFAIDAVPDTAGNNINLYDGFSQAEKWRTLSSGIGRPAAGLVSGSNVVQVCGGKLRNLKAGETRKATFALVFADSLPDLIRKARAARNFYRSRNQSPAPASQLISFCDGDTVGTSVPVGISRVKVYRDSLPSSPIFTGSGFEAQVYSDSILFISGADSLIESPRVRWEWNKQNRPDAGFNCPNCISGDTISSPYILNLTADNLDLTVWYLNGAIQPQLSGENSVSIQLNPADSLAEICLEKTDPVSGCSRQICRTFRIQIVSKSSTALVDFPIRLYQQPGIGFTLESSSPGMAEVFDLQGKITQKFSYQQGKTEILSNGIPSGLSFLRCSSSPSKPVFRLINFR